MSHEREPLPSQVGDIHLGMPREGVLACLGEAPFDEFAFLGGILCVRQSLDPATSLFETITYCFAQERLFSVIWENATTSPLPSSIARYGPPALRRVQEAGGGLTFVEHRWQQGDIEFIVTDFLNRDGSHSFAVEMCDARVKLGLAQRS